MRQLALLFVLYLFALSAHGQEEGHFNFIHYPAESGIISNQINTAVQDEQGYMWLGGTHGLQRFDGVRFKTFRHDEKNLNSLPSNPVWQLLVDKKKRVWLLMADGKVGIFDTRNFTFREVVTKFKGPVSPNTALKRLIKDEYGNIFYLISGSEVITYDEQANEFSYEYNFFRQKQGWRVTDLIQQPGTNKYWIAIEKGGIAIYNRSTGLVSDKEDNAGKEPAVNEFDKTKSYYNLFFDTKNRLWSVSQEEYPVIHCFSLLIDEFILRNISLYPQVSSYFDIKSFIQQKDGSVWVHGLLLLARYVEGENRFQLVHNGYTNERSIAYEMVHCLYEDKESNLWVCTDNNGLYRFNPSKEFFTNIDHVNRITGKKGDGNVLSFVHTKWNSLLVSTRNDGLYEYDANFNTIPVNIKGINEKSRPFIWHITASKDSNTLWMGADPGFYTVNESRRTSAYFNPPVLANNTIRQLVEDKNGKLWLGTQSKGVYTCIVNKQNNTIKEIAPVPDIPAAQVNKITIDSKGDIWVGTPENGLYVLDAETGKLIMHFGDQEENERKLPERGISSVLQYNDSLILITTATNLLKYNMQSKELKLVGGPNIISGFITAVEKDINGYAWITSTSGLYQVDIFTRIFIIYDRTDGLDNEHFIQSASYALPNGKILFGATHNFIFFTPENIKGRHPVTDVKITDIKLENRSLNSDSVFALKELTLGYDDKPLVIEFSTFLFGSPRIIKYKMGDLDNSWNTSDKTYQAVYNYLPPGTYNFMIRPTDDMGNEQEAITMLKIRVESPLWKSWWFYSLLILIGVAILYLLDRERTAKKGALQKMRSDIADDLHQEVNTALSNINILSEMARLKADTEPEKSKEFIEQIHSRSDNMINAMDDMLWSISPENDSMGKTVSRLKEAIEALKNRHSVQIDLLVDDKVKLLALNMKQRREVFWFFKSGITNVVRTGGDNCLIYITHEKGNLVYTLEFDTTNTNMQQLNNLRQRQELTEKLAAAHARLDVRETKSKTIFVLTIPVLK